MSFKLPILTAAAALISTAAWAEITVEHAYARSSNPVSGAAFMVIHNTAETDDHLIGVTSEIAARTELHTHEETDEGVMRMTHVEAGRPLPAGGTLVLQRGADHVMFMGLEAPLEQDAEITITLIFEDAGEIPVTLPVDQTRAPMAHGDMDHSEMDHSDTEHGTMDHGDTPASD
ncbi:copper chaperone PCu(A)C [Thalassorhabdomicrobium marinisediminis]|uniref:Copper-binding protein n=1 Tax=Thalassorhabdomicrobium marinisediminis TaxID=2170577 RepID=A0A2T7FX31_9RHOB|nr:copper chaperone PCu(A)C [Thalassorhabdomicrobium marinisediminis]PVA06688.1 copper-binding protein [Thalassorhabdomicrobium marinisediminis]